MKECVIGLRIRSSPLERARARFRKCGRIKNEGNVEPQMSFM